jgi:hypothetical protein
MAKTRNTIRSTKSGKSFTTRKNSGGVTTTRTTKAGKTRTTQSIRHGNTTHTRVY